MVLDCIDSVSLPSSLLFFHPYEVDGLLSIIGIQGVFFHF